MGLLDIDFNDPKTMGLLNLGLGILAGNTGRPGDLGQGIMGGFQNYQQMMAQQQRQKMLEQQQAREQEQFDWQKAEREKAAAQTAERQRVLGDVSRQFGIDPSVVAAYPGLGEDIVKNKLIPKPPKIGFAPNGMAYDENNPQGLQVGQVYAKPEAMPSAVQEFEYGAKNPAFNAWNMAQKRAGAPTTSVSYGAPVAGIDAGGNPVFFQPSKEGGTPAIVPGVRPKPAAEDSPLQTPENAGKIAMQQQALTDIAGARALVFGKNGQLNRAALLEAQLPGGGISENSRMLASKIENAIAAKLRLETGAAAPVEEVRNIAKRFMPTQFDSKKSAKDKLDRLEMYFNTSLGQTKGVAKVRKYNPKTGRIE